MDMGRCYNTLTPACSQLTSRAVGSSLCLVCCRSCPAPERQTYLWVHVYIRNVHNYVNTLTLLPARDCKRESGALPVQTLSRASIESGKAYPAPWELWLSLDVNRGHVTSWPDEVPHAARHGGCCLGLEKKRSCVASPERSRSTVDAASEVFSSIATWQIKENCKVHVVHPFLWELLNHAPHHLVRPLNRPRIVPLPRRRDRQVPEESG